ncbi:MAG TPA: ABC transporter permease [Acidimicrobiales bacterium]|nr:ABC transporter permease [Acidimicrobiales bacterium]
MSTSDAHIYEQGYRKHEGARLGPGASIRSLALHSATRALGLRRTFWAKLLPIATVVISYLPASVFVGIAALIPEEITNEVDAIPTYHDYYGFISAAILLFIAIVGPEVLCSDRRHGMLGLYLASPLTRETYLVSKVLGLVPVLGLVTLGPPLLLLVGRVFVDAGPESFGDFLLLLLRAVAGAVAVTAVYLSVSLAGASLTDRRAIASAGFILALFVTGTVSGVLHEALDVNEHVLLLNLVALPFELVVRIYGEPGDLRDVSTAAVVLANVAWTVGGASLVLWRYKKLAVTR